MKIVACLIPSSSLRPIQIHLFLQKAAQLCPATPTLNLRARHRWPSICCFDRGHGWCIGRGRLVAVFVRCKVLRLDFLSTGGDCSLILCVYGVVGRVVAAVDCVVEGAAKCFGCALRVVNTHIFLYAPQYLREFRLPRPGDLPWSTASVRYAPRVVDVPPCMAWGDCLPLEGAARSRRTDLLGFVAEHLVVALAKGRRSLLVLGSQV